MITNVEPTQAQIDVQNQTFWDELCGTSLAKSLGISASSPENLRKFDAAYMGLYPYLAGYVDSEALAGRAVLEVGLGYGTLGQALAAKGAQYFGIDIATGPVTMMRHRMRMLGQPEHQIEQGSVLELPHAEARFDFVYSVGVLHHTGNLPRAIEQVYRVLRPGGKAIIMLYNRHSFRQFLLASKRRSQSNSDHTFKQNVRAAYDSNSKGEAAPHTDYVTRTEVRYLFKQFAQVRIDTQNFDDYSLLDGRLFVSRKHFLNNLARLVGLDLYIVAQK